VEDDSLTVSAVSVVRYLMSLGPIYIKSYEFHNPFISF